MRHALILLPVLTLGATAAQVAHAQAAPDSANGGSPDASVASDQLKHSDIESVLGVQGLPALESSSTSDADGNVAKVTRSRSVTRANYVKTAHAKLPYAKGTAKAQTALWTALRGGDATALTAALDGGAAANEPNRRGVTPLMAAAKAGQNEIVALLMSRGAQLELTDNEGATALFYAVEARAQESADLLLQAGPILMR